MIINNHISYFLYLLFVAVVSFTGQRKLPEDEDYTNVKVGKVTGIRLEALSAELDPHFFSQNLTRNDGAKASDWQIVVNRIKAMSLQKLRVMVLPDWYEPVNDNNNPYQTDLSKFTFDSPEMQSLYKVLDLAQQQNMSVRIVLWGCPTSVSSLLDKKYANVKTYFMADPQKKDSWMSGPNDFHEWAENFSTLIKYLIEERGYTCIKEITPINEPDGGPVLTCQEYVKMVKILNARFIKDGIRNKVRFNLSDNTDAGTYYLEYCSQHLAHEADVFNSHTYIFGYNTPNSTIFNWEKKNVDISAHAGKRHIVGEFGSNEAVGATRQRDINCYQRGVLMTRLILNFLNAGAAGVNYWDLFDQYYNRNSSYQGMMQLGLWKYVKEAYKEDPFYAHMKQDYEVRPQYYSYSLLTRFLKSGAQVHPIELHKDLAVGSAFMSQDRKWTYVIANASYYPEHLAIVNPDASGKFAVYRYEKNNLPEKDNLITSKEDADAGHGKLYIEVSPNSVVLCQQQ